MISLDTTRADRLGCYGYGEQTSPSLDALAAVSVVYTRAVSTTSWTLPGHATLLTGKLTSSHGARLDVDGPISLADAIEGPFERYRARGLSPHERPLPLLLGEHGYATAGIVAGPWLKRVTGLDLGFDHYDDGGIDPTHGRLAPSVTGAALDWLRSRPRDRPFFLFLNYFDPHGPYDPPARFRGAPPRLTSDMPREQRIRTRARWLYDGEIRFMDFWVGKLLDGLRDLDLFDDTWIIVTADHGEALWEDGIQGHGTALERAVLAIPFIVKYPGTGHAPERSDERVQLTDVLPTLLDALGLPIPDDIQGNALGRLGHPVVAEVYPLPFMTNADGDVQALIADGHKLVRKDRGRLAVYDLARDPHERIDLAARDPERAAAMAASLDEYLASLPAPLAQGAPRAMDSETQKALKSLGYVE
ncbi:MAG: sulfatase [Deltaproteobacteria bacterium]|nr:sulfatase [Deltaproteobacteria bacterium]MBW2413241.1 sulfatase [Deltaproteobacteria bacterium]